MATPYKDTNLAIPSCVSLWGFDEAEGTSAADAKSELTGTYSGSLSLNQASLLPNGEGKSAHFTGGKMEKGDTEKLRLGKEAMSVACWVKIDALAVANQTLWDNTNRGYSLFLNSGTAKKWLTYFGTSFKVEEAFTVVKETTYHVCITSTGTKVIYYINGAPVLEDATFTAGATNSNAGIAFAGNPSGGGAALQGYGQYFSVFNTALSQAAVEALYAAGSIVAPEAVTGEADDISASSATLNGTVDPNGTDTSYYFEYGPTEAYGSEAPVAKDGEAGEGAAPVEVEEPLSGLEDDTLYHFRLVAESIGGEDVGEDETFTTAEAPTPKPPSAPRVATPHFKTPFTITTAAYSVEQDSVEEIEDCVETILRTPVGSRIEVPEFGRPDETFAQLTTNPTAETYLAAVAEWEPRSHMIGEARFGEVLGELDITISEES